MTKSVMTTLLAIYVLTVLVIAGLVGAKEDSLSTPMLPGSDSFESEDLRPAALFAE